MAVRKIAFNAMCTDDQHLSSPSRVTYNTVHYNLGNGLSSSTGIFTAPVSGLYVLYFHTRSDSSHGGDFYIKVDNVEKCRSYLYHGYDHGSCLAVVHMSIGSRAWAEPYLSNRMFQHYTTSFAGFLLSHD